MGLLFLSEEMDGARESCPVAAVGRLWGGGKNLPLIPWLQGKGCPLQLLLGIWSWGSSPGCKGWLCSPYFPSLPRPGLGHFWIWKKAVRAHAHLQCLALGGTLRGC